MTMLDDDALAGLFARAADSFEIPADGVAAILARAAGDGGSDVERADGTDPVAAVGEDSGLRSFALAQARRARRVTGAHRIMTAAACVVVALGVAAGAAVISQHTTPEPPINAALAHGGPAAKSSVSAGGNFGIASTTVPSSTGASSSTAGLAPSLGGTAQSSAVSGGGTTGSGTGGAVSTGATANSAPAASASAPSTLNGTVSGARIEQSGSLSLRIAKGALTKDVNQLSFLASAYGGFISSSQSQSGQDSVSGVPSATVTLEVPVANFETVVKKAQSLGTTEALSTKANDVTSQYVNVQAQIAADQASEQQYLTIMTKATSIGDVLSVQSQLNSIQSDIQQLQGQLNVLTSQTTYSSLVTTMTEQSPTTHHHSPPPRRRSGLLSAWDDSVGGFVHGVEGLIRLAGPALFVLLCGLALVLGGRSGWRRYQRHAL